MIDVIRRRGRTWLLWLILPTLLLGACSPTAPSAATPELDAVRIVLLPYVSYAPFHLGLEQGVFAEEGIELERVDVSRSTEALPGLAQGEIDVVPGTVYPGLFNSIGRGSEVQVVAGSHYLAREHCTALALLARSGMLPTQGEADPARFAGARADIHAASLPGFIAEQGLREFGLALDDFELIDIPPPAQVEAFAQGSLDVSIADEPWLSRLVAAGNAEIWLAGQEVTPDMQIGIISFGPSLLTQDRDLGTRFMRAYLRSVELYQQGQTEQNLQVITQALDLEPELAAELCWPAYQADGRPNLDSLQEFQQWAYDRDLLDEVLPVADYWDGSLLEAAEDG